VAVQDDELTTALIPVADRLIRAVHALDTGAVAQAFTDAAELAGDELRAARLLVVVLAGMCIEDQAADDVLAWTHDPDRYADLRQEGVPALLASLRSARHTPHLGGVA
jgi:hypothetical protein